ncbi:glycosyltransferase family 4 protein [Ochrobactrum sp. S1502_03]|uniref:glycosyltransferase family 4 protein n=1 Tax=Ochrobactrum sp. S1502_03 TaxID=3108451 RepID=UPI0037C6A343
MKILVLTNHLAIFGGSEVVSLEVAEVFSSIGCDVSIFTAYIDDPVRSYMEELGIHYGSLENCPSPENFDIIWSQHHLLPYLLAKHGISSIESVFVVNASLSPYEPLEIPGAVADVADMVVANSQETADRLVELGVPAEKVSVFYNAAPDNFNLVREARPVLKRTLIVSNHMPEEVACAADVLRSREIAVDHIGLPSNQRKITPEIISSYDAVISIGKTVQYSLLCETPIYVYDRFGGPGWLTESNVVEAEKFNFSGRCCHRKLSPDAIASELVDGYPSATSAIRALKQIYSQRYLLRNYLTQIIERTSRRLAEGNKRQIGLGTSNLIHREGLLSGQLITLFQVAKHQASEITQLISDAEAERRDLIHSHEEVYSSQRQKIDEKDQIINQLEKKLSESRTEN